MTYFLNLVQDKFKNLNGTLEFSLRLVLVLDIFLTGFSFVLSYYICSLLVPGLSSHMMLIQLPLIIAISSLIFILVGSYRGFVKHDKIKDVYHIFNAICIANILTIVIVVINGKTIMVADFMVPISIIVVHSIISFISLVFARNLYKKFYLSFGIQKVKKTNVFVLSSGEWLNLVYKTITGSSITNSIKIKGFIDLDFNKFQNELNIQVPILLKDEITNMLLIKEEVSRIVIANPLIDRNSAMCIINEFKNSDLVWDFIHFDLNYINNHPGLTVKSIENLKSPNNSNFYYQNKVDSFEASNNSVDEASALIFGDNGKISLETINRIDSLLRINRIILVDINESFLNKLEQILEQEGFSNCVKVLLSKNENNNFERIVKKFNPNLVFLETSRNVKDLNATKKTINKRASAFVKATDNLSLKKTS